MRNERKPKIVPTESEIDALVCGWLVADLLMRARAKDREAAACREQAHFLDPDHTDPGWTLDAGVGCSL